jgi:hypothetical protein
MYNSPLSGATISGLQIGYCTNVHPSRDLNAIRENVINYCKPIRDLTNSDATLGVGLWFSEVSAAQALVGNQLYQLKELLDQSRLVPFTLNGFPQGDFHSDVVKHRVYLPTWWQTERRDYTRNLIQILDRLLPVGQTGSISTLPIAWSSPNPTDEQLRRSASHLMELANELHQLYETTGRRILIAIEPEPGCHLTDSPTLRGFFNRYLSAPAISESQSRIAREYLTLCHDVCHAAVMFEEQSFELRQLAHDGIGIGKVQVSSAVEVEWSGLDADEKVNAMQQLSQFAEHRYLHQTCILDVRTKEKRLIEDLGLAIGEVTDTKRLEDTWRVHFHVPIFLESFGHLKSTQSEIWQLLKILGAETNTQGSPYFSGHYEIETYAWGVLPNHMQGDGLVSGIAKEINWFESEIDVKKDIEIIR